MKIARQHPLTIEFSMMEVSDILEEYCRQHLENAAGRQLQDARLDGDGLASSYERLTLEFGRRAGDK